jgi:hypothetical protein
MGLAGRSFGTTETSFKEQFPRFYGSLQEATYSNPWFTPASIASALNAWETTLNMESLSEWLKPYGPGIQDIASRRVAVIMAGNIPLVGFHDFLCTLLAGHRFIGKLSSNDKILLPAIADVLCAIEPLFGPQIVFTDGTIKEFDAIIATGSNNTARYFEYYFDKYPHIIRKNRNGVAVLNGKESDGSLLKLGKDICSYFGLGCRNVSKIFIPTGFDPRTLFKAIEPFIPVLSDHNKFMNNYGYHRSIYLLNNTPHLDNGVFILTESEQYSSPIPVLYYEFYESIEILRKKLEQDDELIQCIANDVFTSPKTVALGCTQSPGLADYADGTDTMKFLLEL